MNIQLKKKEFTMHTTVYGKFPRGKNCYNIRITALLKVDFHFKKQQRFQDGKLLTTKLHESIYNLMVAIGYS